MRVLRLLMVVNSSQTAGSGRLDGETSLMPRDIVRRPGAGWSVVVGLGLALLAASVFVAFSLIARGIGVPLRTGRIVVVQPTGTGAVVTLAEPPEGRAEPDRTVVRVREESPGGDVVLGIRVVDTDPPAPGADGTPPSRVPEGDGGESARRLEPSRDDDGGFVARTDGEGDGAGEGRPHKHGKALGHHKSRGKAGGRGNKAHGKGHRKAHARGHDHGSRSRDSAPAHGSGHGSSSRGSHSSSSPPGHNGSGAPSHAPQGRARGHDKGRGKGH